MLLPKMYSVKPVLSYQENLWEGNATSQGKTLR